MRDNLYEINKREKIVVAIVGMAHSEELAYLMNKKYSYSHGQIQLELFLSSIPDIFEKIFQMSGLPCINKKGLLI